MAGNDTSWKVTREVQPSDIRCDLPGCSKQADTIHFLPWVAGPKREDGSFPCTKIAFACPAHSPDPCGYWIEVAKWFAPARVSRSGHAIPTTQEHIEMKINGEEAVALVYDRFNEIQRALAVPKA
jgi:hypothetical protein